MWTNDEASDKCNINHKNLKIENCCQKDIKTTIKIDDCRARTVFWFETLDTLSDCQNS